MAQAHAGIEIAASADTVWQLIGGFGALPDWLSYIPASELSEGGRVRRLANPAGDAIVERLVAFDEAERSYTYAILDAPFPVVNYRSTLRVRENGPNASKVEWSGTFTPHGATDDKPSGCSAGFTKTASRNSRSGSRRPDGGTSHRAMGVGLSGSRHAFAAGFDRLRRRWRTCGARRPEIARRTMKIRVAKQSAHSLRVRNAP